MAYTLTKSPKCRTFNPTLKARKTTAMFKKIIPGLLLFVTTLPTMAQKENH